MKTTHQCYMAGSNISIYMCCAEHCVVLDQMKVCNSSTIHPVPTTPEKAISPYVTWAQNGPITVPEIDSRIQDRTFSPSVKLAQNGTITVSAIDSRAQDRTVISNV